MKKLFFVVAMLIACFQFGKTQIAQSIFFELGGPGLASFNFDSRFSSSEKGIGGRLGIGGFTVNGAGVVFVPVGVNYLMGKDGKNYFELGAGATPVFGGDGDDETFGTTFGWLNFGYRLQPLNGGFSFRAFMTPVFGDGFFIPYYGGVSFGYKF